MAAAAFTGTLIFAGMSDNSTNYVRVTMSDVAAAAWVFPDASTSYQLPSDQNYMLTDVIIITGGTDTTNSDIFANQKNTGIVLDHKSNLNTVQNRQFQFRPLPIKGGTNLKFIQRA